MSTKQAIAGVAPPEAGEVTSMTIWPSICAFQAGCWVGRLSGNQTGVGFFTLGKLLAVATIPVSLVLFAWRLLPFVCRRYTLTNRRIIIQKGLSALDEQSVDLDRFDSIEVRVRAGQQFFHAGDLLLKHDGKDVLCLAGVSRPEVFREVCLNARMALVSVREVLQREAAVS